MFRLYGFMEIQQLHYDGVSVSEIARRLDVDVYKTLRHRYEANCPSCR